MGRAVGSSRRWALADDAQETPRTADELRSLTFGFDEHPLEHFRGLNDEAIEAHPGIGPKFRERIQEALAELDALMGNDAPSSSEPPLAELQTSDHAASEPDEPASDHGADDDLEPVGPGTGGPLMVVVMVAMLLLVISAAIWITGGRDGSAELEVRLTDAYQQVAASQEVFGKLTTLSAEQAERQAEAVYAATRSRNLGAAVEQLDDLAASLATMTETVGAVGDQSESHSDAEHPDQKTLLAAANEALEQARAALMMTQPQTQDGLEAACRKLEQAVRALGADEVKE